MANKLRPWSQRAYDPSLGTNTNQFMDWVASSLNQLIGQVSAPSALGQGALSPNTINPTSGTIQSLGGRVTSLATGFIYTATTTTINLYWDGTNGSTLLRIYRDDGTVEGPFAGSQEITQLTSGLTYFFYPYFDEATQTVRFVSQSGATGSPPIAYIATAPELAQAQFLRGHIPLASNLAVTGITTVVTPPTVIGGGGGGGGVYIGKSIL
jgi:hypothetical protein